MPSVVCELEPIAPCHQAELHELGGVFVPYADAGIIKEFIVCFAIFFILSAIAVMLFAGSLFGDLRGKVGYEFEVKEAARGGKRCFGVGSVQPERC